MIKNIATFFVVCGLPASSKTTLAKEIELKHKVVFLSEDEWMDKLFGRFYDLPFAILNYESYHNTSCKIRQ